MKKIILAILAMFVLGASAQAEESKAQRNIGAFIGTGFGNYGFSYGVSYKAPLSVKWDFSKNWGGQWGYEVVGIRTSDSVSYFVGDVTYALWEIAGLATYTWTFAKNQSATVKTGLAFGGASVSYSNATYSTFDSSTTVFGVSYGASYNYDLGKAGIISLGYYDFSLGLTYAYKF